MWHDVTRPDKMISRAKLFPSLCYVLQAGFEPATFCSTDEQLSEGFETFPNASGPHEKKVSYMIKKNQ